MTLLDGITQYWPIIGFVLGIAFHGIWAYFEIKDTKSRVVILEKAMHDMEVTQDSFQLSFAKDIIEIKTKLEFIIKSLNK